MCAKPLLSSEDISISQTEIFETHSEELARGVHRDLKQICIMIDKGRNNTNRRREDA
jgi:hypothetical protein